MPGIPFLVQVIFLVLKLAGVIAWPWVWVLAPLWISAGLGLVFFVLALLGVGVFGFLINRR